MKSIRVKHVIKFASIIIAILFFFPTFTVSCSGQNVNLSACKVMTGIRYEGETVTEPHLILALLLLLPVAIAVMWFVKGLVENKIKNIATLAISAVDIIVWIILSVRVKSAAEENYCSAKTAVLFWVNMILLLVVLVTAIMLVLGKLSDDSLITELAATSPRLADDHSSLAVSEGSWTCSNCHTVNAGKSNFCVGCGTKKPEEPVVVEETKKEQTMFCEECGTKLEPGAKFCYNCGNKIE